MFFSEVVKTNYHSGDNMVLRLLFFTCLSIACSGPAFFSQKIARNDLFKNDVEILDDGVVKE